MHRRSDISLALLALVAAWAGHSPAQQPDLRTPDASAAGDALLAEFDLVDPLAASLRFRLKHAQGESRTQLADQLSKLYARMLAGATTSERRRDIEDRCRELLRVAPDADSFALKLTIATAQYLPIEELVERRSMKMSGPEDDSEAERVLRSVRPIFEDLATRLNNRVKQIKDKKDRGPTSDSDAEIVQAELDEATGLRSRAYYYAGWCNYYLALLTGDKHAAANAMENFGGLLNAVAGRPATIDRLPESNLRYEHVAKAVIGCALAASLLGNHVEAERWLDALERAPEAPAGALSQMLRRRLAIFAAADRWADIKVTVTRARQPDRSAPPSPLSLADARLLAVLSLEALQRTNLRPGLRSAAEEMAQTGLADLVARGEAGHVLNLVNIYGTALIGKDGFINNYVRGLRAFDDAKNAQKSAGGGADEPATSPEVINQFHQAADVFAATIAAPDADKFPVERANAEICRGLALFGAGSLEAAADSFEAAFASGGTEAQRRDALWYGVVALDRAVAAGKPSLTARREKLATLYVQTFPHSDRAVELLLQRLKGGTKADQRDIETLLKVAPDSPMYLASRRVAARLLYKSFQRTAGDDREFAILRFADVAEELLKAEYSKATLEHSKSSKEAAEDALIHARQLADALLSARAPDAARAEAALANIDSVASFHAIDLRQHDPELSYDRLRIAWAKGDDTAAQKELNKLRALGGVFASAAERTMYQRAGDAWAASPQDMQVARRVVTSGSRVLLEPGTPAESLAAVRDRVAAAAFAVWQAETDTAMRDVAMRTDQAQLDAGRRTAPSLRRMAIAKEAAADSPAALALWLELLAGLEDASPPWYEARYESIRLLAQGSPTDAAITLRQHKLLHPTWGPAPWDAKFAELETKIGPPPAPAAKPGGGG